MFISFSPHFFFYHVHFRTREARRQGTGDRASDQDPPQQDRWVIINTVCCISVFCLSPVQESFSFFPGFLSIKNSEISRGQGVADLHKLVPKEFLRNLKKKKNEKKRNKGDGLVSKALATKTCEPLIDTQHPHRVSQPSVTLVLGDSVPLSGL